MLQVVIHHWIFFQLGVSFLLPGQPSKVSAPVVLSVITTKASLVWPPVNGRNLPISEYIVVYRSDGGSTQSVKHLPATDRYSTNSVASCIFGVYTACANVELLNFTCKLQLNGKLSQPT